MTGRILMTGASGFVGKSFWAYSSKHSNREIRPLDRSDAGMKRLADQLLDIDIIMHFAGKAHDLKKVSDPSEYYTVNTEFTKQVYDAFLESKARTFIMLSSVKAAADKITGYLTESHLCNPETDYGKSKLLAEQYIISKPAPHDKRVFILRPSMIHGPGNKGNLNLLYKIVEKGIPWPLGAFHNKRSFCSIENLCFVLQELCERQDIPSSVYNIADDEAVSTNTLIKLISEEIGRKAKIYNLSKPLIKRLAAAGDFLHFPLNTERLRKLTESYIVDNRKLVSVLKKSLPVHATEGLRRTIRSFKNNP